jgi:hypothetical protein
VRGLQEEEARDRPEPPRPQRPVAADHEPGAVTRQLLQQKAPSRVAGEARTSPAGSNGRPRRSSDIRRHRRCSRSSAATSHHSLPSGFATRRPPTEICCHSGWMSSTSTSSISCRLSRPTLPPSMWACPPEACTVRPTAAMSSGTSSSSSLFSTFGCRGLPEPSFATGTDDFPRPASPRARRDSPERCSPGRARATAGRRRSSATSTHAPVGGIPTTPRCSGTSTPRSPTTYGSTTR